MKRYHRPRKRQAGRSWQSLVWPRYTAGLPAANDGVKDSAPRCWSNVDPLEFCYLYVGDTIVWAGEAGDVPAEAMPYSAWRQFQR